MPSKVLPFVPHSFPIIFERVTGAPPILSYHNSLIVHTTNDDRLALLFIVLIHATIHTDIIIR